MNVCFTSRLVWYFLNDTAFWSGAILDVSVVDGVWWVSSPLCGCDLLFSFTNGPSGLLAECKVMLSVFFILPVFSFCYHCGLFIKCAVGCVNAQCGSTVTFNATVLLWMFLFKNVIIWFVLRPIFFVNLYCQYVIIYFCQQCWWLVAVLIAFTFKSNEKLFITA